MIPFNVPYTSGDEKKYLSKVMEEGKFSGNGHFSKQCQSIFREVYGFESNFPTTSCTAAIQMVAIALDLKNGDEVILPSYTFSSTPNPFLIAGATVRFADSEKNNPNISLASIASLVTSRTRAIMVVHYGGSACDVTAIKALCVENNIKLIEDAAQCIDGYHKGQPLGSFGDFSVFSFHETKNIHCGEGGLLVVNDKDYVSKIETIWNYGTNKKAFLSGEVDSYEWTGIGLSFCLSELNAAYLYAQLQEVKKVTEKRKTLWDYYFELLSPLSRKHNFNLPILLEQEGSYHTFYIVTKKREEYLALQEYLLTHFILAVQHYYPLHESKFAKENGLTADLPNATFFGDNLLRLPLHCNLTISHIEHIVSLIQKFYEQENKY